MLRNSLRLLLVVLLFAQVTTGFAQEPVPPQPPEIPLMGSEASPALPAGQTAVVTPPDTEDAVYRILVIGDSLAGGLGAGMSRVVQVQPGYEILNRFNESSGLARREVYDWSTALAKIVATKPVDAVVVLVGMNDRQEIRDGNIRHVFKSPDWEKGYSANVDGLIESVKLAGAKLYWISVPPMANAGFDADMRYVSDIHRQRVAAKQGHYVDVRPFFLAPDGSFVDRGVDDLGNDRKLRDSDGVRFMKAGNNRFGQLVLGAIKALKSNSEVVEAVAVAKPTSPTAATADVAAAASGVTVVTEPPSFGQAGVDGEDIVFRADAFKTPAAQQVSVAQRSANQSPALATSNRFSAKAGSNAEKLFVDGVVGAAPVGRFDDYSVPPIQ